MTLLFDSHKLAVFFGFDHGLQVEPIQSFEEPLTNLPAGGNIFHSFVTPAEWLHETPWPTGQFDVFVFASHFNILNELELRVNDLARWDRLGVTELETQGASAFQTMPEGGFLHTFPRAVSWSAGSLDDRFRVTLRFKSNAPIDYQMAWFAWVDVPLVRFQHPSPRVDLARVIGRSELAAQVEASSRVDAGVVGRSESGPRIRGRSEVAKE